MNKLVLTTAAAAVLAATTMAARAEETNPTIVHRQAIYKVVNGHMNNLKAALFLKGQTDAVAYDADAIVAAFQHMGDAYPEGSDKGETKAKSNIWTERPKFQEAGKKAFGAAQTLAEAAKSGDQAKTTDAFKALGGACKACHEDFRKD
ncbi:MAG TPA: cytochrome c [Magnetospirillum sp.]|jgi:cytochrome c556|nr:cytochrome c [Magnetospirillum sp.]